MLALFFRILDFYQRFIEELLSLIRIDKLAVSFDLLEGLFAQTFLAHVLPLLQLHPFHLVVVAEAEQQCRFAIVVGGDIVAKLLETCTAMAN